MSRNKTKYRPPIPVGQIASAKLKPADEFARDIAALPRLPVTYQALSDLSAGYEAVNLFALRLETFKRIETITHTPLICYITKTHHIPPNVPVGIDDSDLIGFGDLISTVEGDAVDVLLVSNGGSAEATQRIVHLLRNRFRQVRFIVPGNAYSAATLLCFSGDWILMASQATLGPIDPQITIGPQIVGIPARAILRGFEAVEERLAKEGPKFLTAYMPLLEKYDLHLFEICKSAQALSLELASTWLSQYMLKVPPDDVHVAEIVSFFGNYDIHKTHARPIDRTEAQKWGLQVQALEQVEGLDDLVRSLYNQYEFMFEKSLFFKLFENGRGINWGRQISEVTIQIPQPGPPRPSKLPE